jgi:hypothetical protein
MALDIALGLEHDRLTGAGLHAARNDDGTTDIMEIAPVNANSESITKIEDETAAHQNSIEATEETGDDAIMIGNVLVSDEAEVEVVAVLPTGVAETHVGRKTNLQHRQGDLVRLAKIHLRPYTFGINN